MSAEERLTKVFEKAQEVPFGDEDKFILFSDCHRSDNSWADEFSDNQNLFLHALRYYFGEGFTYIEVGDGDELFENARFDDIRQAHHEVFRQMQDFHKKQRLYLIWGNHDMERQSKKTVKDTLYGYYDRRKNKYESLFEGIEVYEALILKHSEKDHKIFVVHGHQVDLFNYMMWNVIPLWRVNRYFNRHVWKYFQLFGIRNPASPAKYFNRAKKIDEELKKWAGSKNQILIAGHTHSYYLVDPPYFNIGSCVYPDRITGIEIENGRISLVEWGVKVKQDGTFCACKGVLYPERASLEVNPSSN